MVQKYPAYKLHQIPPYTAQDEEALRAYLESEPRTEPPKNRTGGHPLNVFQEPLKKLTTSEEMTPVALFKVLRFFDMVVRNERVFWQGFSFVNQLHEAHRTSNRARARADHGRRRDCERLPAP